MDKKRANNVKANGTMVVSVKIEKDDDADSNHTEPFDLEQFKSSALTERYSVHQNDAALLADFSRILADDSDAETGESPTKNKSPDKVSSRRIDKNDKTANVLDVSDKASQSNRSRTPLNDYILSWADSVRSSQPLSMVASIFSDHDYLSQENTVGIFTGNEERTLNESGSKDANKQNGLASDAPEDVPIDEINDLNSVMQKLVKCKNKTEYISLLNEIKEKTKIMKVHLGESPNGEERQESCSDNVFSRDHSEPLEYYGNAKLLSEPTETDDSDDETSKRLKNAIQKSKNMNRRISMNVETVNEKLTDVQTISDPDERKKAIESLAKNFGMLISDFAQQMTSLAEVFIPKEKEVDSTKTVTEQNTEDIPAAAVHSETSIGYSQLEPITNTQLNETAKRHIMEDSSTDEEDTPVTNKRKKKHHRRKVSRTSKGSFSSTDSEASVTSLTTEIDAQDLIAPVNSEPSVHMKNVESPISSEPNGDKSSDVPIENGEKKKDNDNEDEFLGFEEDKCDNVATNKRAIESPVPVNGDVDKDVIKNEEFDDEDDFSSMGGEMIALTDNEDDIEDGDDDDAEIQRLLDFSSLGVRKQLPPTAGQTSEKTNGVAEPKKPVKKMPKEDLLKKILDEPSDKEDSNESDDATDNEEITEEQFLKERNDLLKQQLMQDSSDESVTSYDESEPIKLNKKQDEYYGDSDYFEDDKATSESDESLIGQFLSGEAVESPSKVDESKPKTKEIKLGGGDQPKTKSVAIPSVRAVGGASDSDEPVAKKPKSAIGTKIFANLDKDEDEIELSSDENDDASHDGKTKKRSGEADQSPDSSNILDTTMFKDKKKEVDSKRLAKYLTTKRNTTSTTVARASPDECISLSSGEDSDLEHIPTEKNDANDEDEEEKETRVKRKLLRDDQLADDTKSAQKEELDRIKRLEKKNERLSQFIASQKSQSSQEDDEAIDENEVVLDYDSKKKMKIAVHEDITKHLKKHQVDGVKFMYDSCYGAVDNLEKFPGSGCILAHCMGLGKTLQLITLLHTVICYPQLKTDRILVICPKSTVMNWKEEIERWIGRIKGQRRLKLFHFPEQSNIQAKISSLREWHRSGSDGNKQAGCFLLGYEAFRVLINYHDSKKGKEKHQTERLDAIRGSLHKYLLDPGADLVVCDEGHMIKNQKSTTSLAVNKIRTKRRIILTGTPIQNNLKEYYSMVNFIKPSFLGTEKEFANLYVNPIKNGQHKDSSRSEIKHMKMRSYVLHKKLSKFVQRREAALLKQFLPQKFEYVLFIPITDVQTKLYEFFLNNNPNKALMGGKSLIPDYTVLRKIWTHPKVLENAYKNAVNAKAKLRPLAAPNPTNANDSGDEPDDVLDTQSGMMSVTNDWWREHLTPDDLETIFPSNKLKVLFEILNVCKENDEKCLIFSAFVAVLDVVEFFMGQINQQAKSGQPKPGLETYHGPWEFAKDYYRLDGKTPKNCRHDMITNFNNPKNRARVFLISSKAGGQGINLIGANRVILLDTSWNPSNDQQNIFRVFRLGQKKCCYIYRLLAMGTMEEKVYSRSVTKQAMSCRVMDEQQIDRHYNMAELTELYTLTNPKMDERPTPTMPKDDLLKYLLHKFPHMVYKYHEHDSLLENKSEQDLSEEEKADAWKQYEEDVKRKNETNMGQYGNNFGMVPNYSNLGPYAQSMYNNYNNLSSVGSLNYPYSLYPNYNPFATDYSNSMRFNDYAAFYNSLMNYNQSTSPNLLSPSHTASVSSPSSLMNNFNSARNWMQSSASPSSSSSAYGNNLLSSLAQSSSTSNNFNSYLNNLYNTLGKGNTNNLLPSSSSNPTAGSALSPPIRDLSALSILAQQQQQQQLLNSAGTSGTTVPGSSVSPSNSSSNGSSSAQGPNAMRNPMLTKELLIPNRNPILDKFNLASGSAAQTSVITKPTASTSTATSQSPVNFTTAALSNSATITPVQGETNNSNKAGSSKTTEASVSSSIAKNKEKISDTSKSSPEPQLVIKDVASINNTLRKSPDTTNGSAAKKPTNNGKKVGTTSSSVTSTVVTAEKRKGSPTTQKPTNTNIGIVYPSKPSNSSSISIIPTDARSSPQLTAQKAATESASKKPTNQPMPTIIRKQGFAGTSTSSISSSEAANRSAVTALTNNRALTVTSTKRVALPPVNNSITVSPIINTGNPNMKKPSIPSTAVSSVVLSKVNAPSPTNKPPSPIVPVAITKVGQSSTTSPIIINKSPSPNVSKPLTSRNANNILNSTTIRRTTIPSSNQRLLNGSSVQMPAPKIVQAKQNAPQPVVRVITDASKGASFPASKRSMPVENPMPIKRSKLSLPSTSRTAITTRTSTAPRSSNVLQGLRPIGRSTVKPNSQIQPVEIVELD